jgi:DAACS family dicarboxylate/amino acid:cation (Na+ or H+) symporter
MSAAELSDRLGTRVLIGLASGIILGLVVRGVLAVIPGWEEAVVRFASQVLWPLGNIFLRMLFFVVIPLVFASLCLGISQLGKLERLGSLAGKTFALFLFNMCVGVGLGLLFMNVAQPGASISEEVRQALLSDSASIEQAARLQARSEEIRSTGLGVQTIVDMFLPANLFGAVAGSSPDRLGNMLALIVFALMVGAAATTLSPDRRKGFEFMMQTLGELMTTIVFWAMRLAPFAVAALISSVVIRFGADYLRALGFFTLGVVFVIALHLFGTMSLLVKVLGRRSPIVFFGAVRTILVTAFSTSSSSATLPTTIAITRERLGVSAPVSGFVLPLGATLNMSGSALFEGCVVLFIAQVYGIDLSITQQLTLLLLAVVTATAVAGIPGGTLPFIVGLLVTFGIPPEGIALVLGVDRLLDMCRTTLNVGADVAVATVVDRFESRAASDANPAA